MLRRTRAVPLTPLRDMASSAVAGQDGWMDDGSAISIRGKQVTLHKRQRQLHEVVVVVIDCPARARSGRH
jgi:hypothetical protein